MVIDANIYWFLEDIFESEEKSEKFMSEVPKTYILNPKKILYLNYNINLCFVST